MTGVVEIGHNLHDVLIWMFVALIVWAWIRNR